MVIVQAAIHEALKKGYFEAYNSETDLVIDMTMDPGTKCFITTSEEGDIKALDFSDMAKKLEKLKRIEQVGRREGRIKNYLVVYKTTITKCYLSSQSRSLTVAL